MNNEKHRRGQGSIIKRGNRYSIVLQLGRDPKTDKRTRMWESGFHTKRDAEKRIGELLHQMNSGLNVNPSRNTVGEFLVDWLDNYVSTRVRARTLEGYRQRAKHIIGEIGNIPLADLRPNHIAKYYTDKSGPLSPGTLIKHHNLIRDCLSHAVKWDLIMRNVAEAVEPPRVRKKEMSAFSVPEIHRFLSTCPQGPWHTMFHTLIWTGLRRSELLGLRWSDLDLDVASLQVRQSLVRLQDGTYVFEEPKTFKGLRTLDLAPSTCLSLRIHRENQQHDAGLLGIPFVETNLVFGHPDGSPRTPSTVTQQFRRIAKRAGFSDVRLHDLRHTHASLMLQQGTDMKTISTRLGHASIAFTMDTYAHLLPGMQKSAMEKFEAALNTDFEIAVV